MFTYAITINCIPNLEKSSPSPALNPSNILRPASPPRSRHIPEPAREVVFLDRVERLTLDWLALALVAPAILETEVCRVGKGEDEAKGLEGDVERAALDILGAFGGGEGKGRENS